MDTLVQCSPCVTITKRAQLIVCESHVIDTPAVVVIKEIRGPSQ